MNNGIYKLVFSRVRHMMIAVADFATGQGAEGGSATQRESVVSFHSIGSSLPMRAVAFVAMLLLGAAASESYAQIVAAPGSAAQVIQTQNGLQQVNIAKPSAAGVSLNNYSQFDVPGKGAILNNSPTIVQTQQAGYINGNPNLSPGQSAGIIVNQVLSNSPSQLNGFLEVAGQRAEVVVANQLALSAYDLVNRNGTITQAGTAPTTFTVTGTLDNTSGSIQTNAADLTLAPAALVNDNGTITSSGTRVHRIARHRAAHADVRLGVLHLLSVRALHDAAARGVLPVGAVVLLARFVERDIARCDDVRRARLSRQRRACERHIALALVRAHCRQRRIAARREARAYSLLVIVVALLTALLAVVDIVDLGAIGDARRRQIATRDHRHVLGVLAPIFDKNKIEAGFEIVGQFTAEAGTFVANRVKEADAASAAAKDPNLTPEQRVQAQQQADELNKDWGPNGTYRQVMTALTVAAGGNVTAGAGRFAQAATVAYLQELGANEVKQLADSLKDETARAALHAIVGCAGAAGSGANCGAGAMGAAASSVIGSLLGPTENMSAADRLVRENLVNSLVAGVATGMGASGADTATAAGAAQIEVQNNQVSILPKKNPLSVDLVKTFCGAGKCTDDQVKQLVQTQNQMNEASGKNAVTAAGAVAAVAAIPALAVLGPEALTLALTNPAAAVNAGIITAETAAAIVTNSVAPSVAVEGAAARAGSAADMRTGTQLRNRLAFQDAGLLD
ncbi:filamentous hemagglutinin N-terminal domain-containing protein [Caballeronia sp. LZ062]|uniref:two-partner secretion domain-containing protein n=1 Tax=unclassified Caballeronia TaxID=2646786 RepID=UPI0028587DB3|nr:MULTISPECIES: filamentous hemagglutinin N-terminal domain-containing protein [unclassified Caballeronia]MDR5856738.1 filamentous hemagglutinin N-terminal domain-containing protein [Caballeronia sp. LZ050]MDR5869865.1 filamentous hemagglutinin N-terminal domain-containing protein [Caballeronia sp. LZ062]